MLITDHTSLAGSVVTMICFCCVDTGDVLQHRLLCWSWCWTIVRLQVTDQDLVTAHLTLRMRRGLRWAVGADRCLGVATGCRNRKYLLESPVFKE